MSKRPSTVDRRSFLKTAGALTSVGVWSSVIPTRAAGPNEKLNIACIGTANRAAEDINGVKGENIAAICDIDDNFLKRAQTQFPDARTYIDYRELIDKEGDKIDAVVVATSDHHHAPASIRAIRAGKHVYCEKPLTHTIQEARILAEAAKEAGVATQMGTQIHAGNNYRRVVEIVQSGVLGDIEEVHVWVGKSWGGGELPEKHDQPPAELHWDLWLGPAPERPFAVGRYHPAQWRKWWAFGNGTLGDMGCHYCDLPFWALKLRHPISCSAAGPPPHPETCPLGMTAEFQFPARGDLSPCKLTWYDGNMTPKQVAGERVKPSGVMFVGSEGKMFADYSSYKLFPKEKFAAFEPPAPTIPNSIGHHAEWIKACKDGSETTCNFDYSGALSETILLGCVAYRTGETIEWDAAALKSTNSEAANALITKEYREGWEVEAAELVAQ